MTTNNWEQEKKKTSPSCKNQSISHCSLLSKIAIHLHIRNYCQLFRSINFFQALKTFTMLTHTERVYQQQQEENDSETIFELNKCWCLTFYDSHRKLYNVETSHRLKLENCSHCFFSQCNDGLERNTVHREKILK